MAEEAADDTQELSWWVPIWEFFIHAVVGSALFMLIALPAVGIYWFVKVLESSSAQLNMALSPWLVWSFHSIEIIIIVSDLAMFIIFMTRSVHRTIRKL